MRPSERDPHLAEMWLPYEEGVELSRAGRSERALSKLEEALAAGERLLGPDSAHLYDILEGLHVNYLFARRYEEAAACGLRALDRAPAVHGTSHPRTGDVMDSTAQALRQVGRHREALTLDQHNLVIQTQAFGRRHPATIRAAVNITASHLALGERGEARDYLGIAERGAAVTDGVPPHTLARMRAHRRAIEDGVPGPDGRSTFPEFAPEQEPRYRADAEDGDLAAMVRLGGVLERQGRASEAERWYRRAASEGVAPALAALGALLYDTGRKEEAERCLGDAAAAGDVHGAFNLGILLLNEDRPGEAERWLLRAHEAGVGPRPAHMLALALERLGRDEEAGHWYRSAADAGLPEASGKVGRRLADAGDLAGAEPYMRRAAEGGRDTDVLDLALFLGRTGRPGDRHEAERLLRRVAERDPIRPAGVLGALLLEQGRPRDAEPWLVRAGENGDVDAMMNLYGLTTALGRPDEALRWLRRAADAGDPQAADLLRRLPAGPRRSRLWRRRSES
ncbi:tetratricopeptide/SEL1-like repeat protein [Streptomyces sp. NPDC127049]|uniref:tetratricopeptide/SEL1-like repeat protein n=1 Tax=Streptomyces sp. NPDC127049 TaxID=3347118 RepID=UPI00365DEAA4